MFTPIKSTAASTPQFISVPSTMKSHVKHVYFMFHYFSPRFQTPHSNLPLTFKQHTSHLHIKGLYSVWKQFGSTLHLCVHTLLVCCHVNPAFHFPKFHFAIVLKTKPPFSISSAVSKSFFSSLSSSSSPFLSHDLFWAMPAKKKNHHSCYSL